MRKFKQTIAVPTRLINPLGANLVVHNKLLQNFSVDTQAVDTLINVLKNNYLPEVSLGRPVIIWPNNGQKVIVRNFLFYLAGLKLKTMIYAIEIEMDAAMADLHAETEVFYDYIFNKALIQRPIRKRNRGIVSNIDEQLLRMIYSGNNTLDKLIAKSYLSPNSLALILGCSSEILYQRLHENGIRQRRHNLRHVSLLKKSKKDIKKPKNIKIKQMELNIYE